MLPMYLSILVARSWLSSSWNSSRGFVDELGVALAGDEGRVLEDVGDKGDVGLDAPDVDLVDGRAALRQTPAKVLSQVVTFTRRES